MRTASRPAVGRCLAGGRLSLPFPLRWALLVATCSAVMGCAIDPKLDLEELAPESGPLILQSVPFYPQTEYQCGPAALAGVLGESGVGISPEQLTPQVYLPERQGSLQVELLAATRRAGRIAYVVDTEPSSLIRELQADRPVLVLQNLRTPRFPVWHYAVVIGFDAAANDFILNSGKHERMEERASTFLRTWDWAERWGMVALEPGDLPSSPDRLRYYQAVAAFESLADDNAAHKAWSAALTEWPNDYRPGLALGNLAYQAANYESAIRHFRQALKLSPGEAVVENNLAEAMAAIGCPKTAEQRLSSFLANLSEDSPWRADLIATLNGLYALPGKDLPTCGEPQSTTPSSPSVK